MKIFLILTAFLISSMTFSQTDRELKGKPKTLDETFVYLDKMFDDTAKYGFMTLPEDVATSRLHFGLGMWIRNNWGLWRNSELKKYFLDKGIVHPDDMSGIIFTSYHIYLNKQAIDLEGQIELYHDFQKDMVQKGDTVFPPKGLFYRTPDSVLIKYFPIGDIIQVRVHASYRTFFTTYASGTTATAIVKEHKSDKLLIEIISMKMNQKLKPDIKVGDKYEINLNSCSLLPPKNWTYKNKR